MSITDLLKDWGPNSQRFQLSDELTEYVWVFERKVIEKESMTTGTMNSIKKAISKSVSQTSGSCTSYGINTTASKYNLGGYGSIMNSYTSINKKSFLNYYSTNVTSHYFNELFI